MLVIYDVQKHEGLQVYEVRFSEVRDSIRPGGFGLALRQTDVIIEDPYRLYMVIEDEVMGD